MLSMDEEWEMEETQDTKLNEHDEERGRSQH